MSPSQSDPLNAIVVHFAIVHFAIVHFASAASASLLHQLYERPARYSTYARCTVLLPTSCKISYHDSHVGGNN